MKKVGFKFLVAKLAFSMIVGLNTAVFADTTKGTATYTDANGITYEVNDTTMEASITSTTAAGSLTGSMATVNVPTGYGVTVGDYKITKISGDYVFLQWTLTDVTFDNLDDISGGSAFTEAKLTNVDFPVLVNIDTGSNPAPFAWATIHKDCDLSALTTVKSTGTTTTTGFCAVASFPEGFTFESLKEISSNYAFDCCDFTASEVNFPALETLTGVVCFDSARFPAGYEFPALKTIDGCAFLYASAVTSIKLPALENLDYSTVNSWCIDFQDIYLPATPPTAIGTIFENTDPSKTYYVHPPTIADMPKYAAVAADGDRYDKYWYGWTITDISWLTFDANGGTLQGTDDGYRVGNNGAKLSGNGSDISNIP